MDIVHRHEDADDQARLSEVRVLHGRAQGVGLALDVDDARLGLDFTLVDDDPVGGREEQIRVREDRSARIAEEILLGYPLQRLVLDGSDIRFDPFRQALRHCDVSPFLGVDAREARWRTEPNAV